MSILSNAADSIFDVSGRALGQIIEYQRARENVKDSGRNFEIAKRQADVAAFEAQKAVEEAATARTQAILNNQQLFGLMRWLILAIGAALVGLIVGRVVRKRRK